MDRRVIFSAGGGYPFAIASVLLASLVLLPFRALLSPATVMLAYVPVIIAITRFSGVRASVASALVAFVALDWLFVPPYYHLSVASPTELIGLAVFLLVALISGQQTARLRQRERASLLRQRELELLNRLSFQIASENSVPAIAEFVVAQITRVLGAERAAIYAPGETGGEFACIAADGRPEPSGHEAELVAWVARTGKAVGMPPAAGVPWDQRIVSVGAGDAMPGTVADAAYLPLLTASSLEGAMVVEFAEEGRPNDDDARLLAAVANLAASSLNRQRVEEEASRAAALHEADRLKSTLVSSVSHELKTPLAAATARVTGLLEEGAERTTERTLEELTIVSEDLARLNDSIGDLLDLSRLESDSWRPTVEAYEVGDILGTMLTRLPAEQQPRVHFDIAENLPPVSVDFAQLVRAFVNLVDNALVYSPASEPVFVAASLRRGEVVITVEDRGPGIDDAEKDAVFGKFYRGSASAAAPSGTGLGLAIAREIVRSNAGRIWVEHVEPHGARFLVAFPAAPEAE